MSSEFALSGLCHYQAVAVVDAKRRPPMGPSLDPRLAPLRGETPEKRCAASATVSRWGTRDVGILRVVRHARAARRVGRPSSRTYGDTADARERVERGLAQLDPEDRAVDTLLDLEGLSGDETARVLQLSLAAMKSRLHCAHLLLAAAIRRSVDE